MTRRETAFGARVAYRRPARPGRWRTVEDVELATLGWVHGAHHQPAVRLPRRPTAGRVRGKVPRYPAGRHVLVEIK